MIDSIYLALTYRALIYPTLYQALSMTLLGLSKQGVCWSHYDVVTPTSQVTAPTTAPSQTPSQTPIQTPSQNQRAVLPPDVKQVLVDS